VILLKAENTTEGLDNYTSKMMKQLNNTQILRQGYRYVNGMDAYQTFLSMVTDSTEGETQRNEAVNVDISCIRKGGIIFTFFSAASQPDFPTYQYTVSRTIDSFNELRSPGHLKRRPYRLSIRRARQGQTLRTFLSNLGTPAPNWNQIALLNGMELDQPLSDSQLIKIIN
jgi:predicted Zn-dependent protease